jgi:SAM-dependent methyltransferase
MWRRAGTAEMTRADVDFIQTELALEPGAHILDVPCGNGRHANQLASRGYRVTGADFCGEFVEEARRAGRAEFVQTDMRHPPNGPYDGAYCFGNSFGYLEEGGDGEFLRAVARVLRPGARFILDTGHVVESLLPHLRDEATYQVGDITMDLHHTYDVPRSVLRTQFSFTRDGVTDVRQGEAWLYTARELRAMLEQAGLYPVAWYGATDRTPYRLRANRLLLVSELRE